MKLISRTWAATFTMALSLAGGQALAGDTTARGRDEAAIRQRAKDYLSAVEQGDGERIASFWTADGDYIDETGEARNGRQLARQTQARVGAAEHDQRWKTTLRFVSPDVVIEDGALSVTADRYTAIWVKQDGTWLLDGVRELGGSPASHRGRLHELAWMIGDWVSEDEAKAIHLTCKWSDDQHFLLREIDVRLSDRGPLHVSQRIGWDARERQIRSWTFDADGGFGDALWFNRGDRWLVEAQSVLPNGSRSTGTNVYSMEGPDAFLWTATNVENEGEPAPDRSVRLVRATASGE